MGVGVSKFLTVRHLGLRQLRRSGLFVANGSNRVQSPIGAAGSALMALLRSFGFFAVRCYKYSTPTELCFLGGSLSIKMPPRWGNGVPCGTWEIIGMAFQGRGAWLISGVPAGRFGGPGWNGSLQARELANFSLSEIWF